MDEEIKLYQFLHDVCNIGNGKPVKNPEVHYRAVCDWLDNFWHDSGQFFCWGCFESTTIEHHHIISRQDMAKIGKPWLLIDPENLIPLCNHCHHNKWHDGGIRERLELKCIDVILHIYKQHSNELYWKLYYKLNPVDK